MIYMQKNKNCTSTLQRSSSPLNTVMAASCVVEDIDGKMDGYKDSKIL